MGFDDKEKELFNILVGIKQFIKMNGNRIRMDIDYSIAAHDCTAHSDKEQCKNLEGLRKHRIDLSKQLKKKEKELQDKFQEIYSV